MPRVRSNRTLPQNIVFAIALFFLCSPFLILIFSGGGAKWPSSSAFIEVYTFTLFQAFVSAVVSICLGITGGAGLIWLSRKVSGGQMRFAQFMTALPNAAPVIVLLLAVMKFMPFLRGAPGLIGVHALLNTGIVAIAFARFASEKLSAAADLAWIEGASRFQFLRAAFGVLQTELAGLFLFVFALCFASFAVPITIGGSRATVIEVLIWQKIRIEGDWEQALGLAFIQLASILVLSVLLAKETRQPKALRTTRSPLLSFAPGLIFALAPALLIVAALLDRPWRGLLQLMSNDALIGQLADGAIGSIVVSGGVFILVAVLLSALSYANPQGRARKILLGYAAPTSVLTGFAMLIVWRHFGWASYVKIVIALALVSAPGLYRFRLDGELQSLEGQRSTALTLGSSAWMTFTEIVFPQVVRTVAMLSGLAAVWALGDFALSDVIAERDLTLGMHIESLMSSYRFDIASFLILSMAVAVGLLFLLVRALVHVKDGAYVDR